MPVISFGSRFASIIFIAVCTFTAAAHAQIIQEPPPAPKNLRASLVDTGAGEVLLKWDPKAPNDTSTHLYELFIKGPGEDEFYRIVNRYTIDTNSLRMPLGGRGIYEYQVSAIDAQGNESKRSNIATLITPTNPLWPVNNREGRLTGANVHISWSYSREDAWDLVGFRIFQDGKQVADVKELGPDTTGWTSGLVDKDKPPRFEIQAVTEYSGETEKTYVRVKPGT